MKLLGVEHFHFEQLAECNVEQLDELEVRYILQCIPLARNGYNVVLGNHAQPTYLHESAVLPDMLLLQGVTQGFTRLSQAALFFPAICHVT